MPTATKHAVLVHGDVSSWNALEATDAFKLVDPDGLLADAEYDLVMIMREDALDADLRERAHRLATLTGLHANAIWDGASSSGSRPACLGRASGSSRSPTRCCLVDQLAQLSVAELICSLSGPVTPRLVIASRRRASEGKCLLDAVATSKSEGEAGGEAVAGPVGVRDRAGKRSRVERAARPPAL